MEAKRRYALELHKLLRRVTGRDRAIGFVVLSFPKSGRTWHRLMLGRYLTLLTDNPPERAMDLNAVCRDALIDRVVYTHNGANFNDGRPCGDPRVANAAEWAGKPVLLIVRDPRDVLVSAYHHAKYRDRRYSGTISDFVRAPETGIEKILTALNRWHDSKHLAKSFDVISYESMHEDPEGVLDRTVACLGLKRSPAFIKEAVAFSTFGKMKDYERTNKFGDSRMARREAETGAKVRVGKVGGYVDHLSVEDLRYIDDRIAQIGDPFSRIGS